MAAKDVFWRTLYTLQMLKDYRQPLGEVYRQPRVDQLFQTSPQQLKADGVDVIALDFDGVLSSESELQPEPEVAEWLKEAIQVFGADKVFVLTNKPIAARIEHFEEHYPGVKYVYGVRKKPYPDGLERIAELSQTPAEKVIVFDDRLLTGCLAGCIANTRVGYIRRPYKRFFRRPVKESFFLSLRVVERIIIKFST
ncbi:MAG: HAD family hydrolase [Pseudomonadota bacterium]